MAAILRNFLKSDSGNTLVTFAIAAVPMLAVAGLPMDYIRLQNRQSAAQIALDQSLLSVASVGAKFSAESAKTAFLANFSPADSALMSFEAKQLADGSISGRASFKMDTSLMAALGINSMVFDAESTVKPVTATALNSVSFQPTSAKGAYDKEIFFFIKDKDGNIIKETKVLDYDYTWNAKGGTAKTQTASGNGTEKLTPGSYGSYGISMKIYEDLTYKGKRTSPVTRYSDDKDASKWTKTSGTCDGPGGQTNSWEDGGDTDFADFKFILTCTTTTVSTGELRLTK